MISISAANAATSAWTGDVVDRAGVAGAGLADPWCYRRTIRTLTPQDIALGLQAATRGRTPLAGHEARPSICALRSLD